MILAILSSLLDGQKNLWTLVLLLWSFLKQVAVEDPSTFRWSVDPLDSAAAVVFS